MDSTFTEENSGIWFAILMILCVSIASFSSHWLFLYKVPVDDDESLNGTLILKDIFLHRGL